MNSFNEEFKKGLPAFGTNYMSYSNDISYNAPDYDNYIQTNQGVYPELKYINRIEMMKPAGKEEIKTFEVGNYFECPLCKEIAIMSCCCVFKDAKCAQGHYWFLNGKLKQLGKAPGH